MKVLLACEESQTVCLAFRQMGIEAYSCDILDQSGGFPEFHIKDDVLKVMNGWVKVIHADECLYEDWDEDMECAVCPECLVSYSECYHPGPTMDIEYQEFDGVLYGKVFEWDMMIAFPPCTHLALSGAKHFEQKRKDGRQKAAIDFFMSLVNSPIKRWAIENPMGVMNTIFRKPDQVIQPYNFGDSATKTTCLWLNGLPKLKAENYDAPLFGMTVDKGQFHVTKGGNKLPKWYNLPPSEDRGHKRSKTFPGIAKSMASQWGNYLNALSKNTHKDLEI